MNVISVIRKYIIKDLTGLIENYYIQKGTVYTVEFGQWINDWKNWGHYEGIRVYDWGLSYRTILYDWDCEMYGACKHGCIEIVRLLISKGATEFNRALHYACRSGNMKLVKYIVKKGANDWNEGLYEACEGGHMKIVKYMIKKGAKNWNQGLKEACRGGHMEIVKYMIKKGANEWDLNEWPYNKDNRIREYLMSLN